MGRGSTWSRQLPWLTRFGAVYTYDAPPGTGGHEVEDPHPVSTERFVADLADAVAELGRPAILIGHSMGGLHSWCLAAARPELVKAVVVEDMAPDFKGQTTGGPGSRGCMRCRSSSPRRSRFMTSSVRWPGSTFSMPSTGRVRLAPARPAARWLEIAAQWGTRDYWEQWRAVRVPVLLLEPGAPSPPHRAR